MSQEIGQTMEHLSKTVISWASILDDQTREQAIMTASTVAHWLGDQIKEVL